LETRAKTQFYDVKELTPIQLTYIGIESSRAFANFMAMVTQKAGMHRATSAAACLQLEKVVEPRPVARRTEASHASGQLGEDN
jgi:hypothetical protein